MKPQAPMTVLPSFILPFICLLGSQLGTHGPTLAQMPTALPDNVTTQAQEIALEDLVKAPQTFHRQQISVRGQVTQLELHLDESELYLDFVFRLSQGPFSILVYGRHDRTQGAPAMSMNERVEVVGFFWKEQNRDGTSILNILEAITVAPYPSSIPSRT